VCRFCIAASKQSLDEAPYINCLKLSQTSKRHLYSSLSAFLLIDKPWFLTEGKLAAIFIKTFSWGFPTGQLIYFINSAPSSFLAPSSARYQQVFWRRCRGLKKKKLPHQLHFPTSTWHQQQVFWRRCRGRVEDFSKGSFRTHILYFVIVLLYFIYFTCIVLYQKPKKIRIIGSCFYLSAFSFAKMTNPENTKLCDFTSTNNSDFICTPIAPPATAANFYEIKLALLNLVMKEQFSGASTEDTAAHLNNFVELCEMQKYKDVDSDIIKLKLFPFSLRGKAKDWLLSLTKNSIDSWAKCKDAFYW
jgi:hypothetical protein